MGEYYKKPLECEQVSRNQARRSIVAKVAIKKGEILTREKLTFKRPGTGISPSMLDFVLGGIALEDINEDDILTFKQVRLVDKN